MSNESTVDQTVFGSKDSAPTGAEDNQNQETVTPTVANEYIGEGKKYATEAIALAAIAPAQNHISGLEQELVKAREANEALLADLQKRETAEEIISRINPTQPEVATPAPTVDMESVRQAAAKAASDALAADRQVTLKLANEKMVSDKLKADYGDSIASVLADKSEEVGMSIDELKAMSQSNPKAVLAMFDKYQSIDLPSKSSNGSSVISSQIKPASSRPKIMGASTTSELNAEWRRCKDLNN